MSTIDWRLVLEFVKALAGPVATVTVALLAVNTALRTFVRQKAIERQLEWFGRLHRELDALRTSLSNMSALMDLNKPDAISIVMKEVLAESEQLRFTCDEAILHASPVAFNETQKIRRAIIQFHQAQIRQRLDRDTVSTFADQFTEIFHSLAVDLRAELRLPPLALKP